MGNSNAKAHSGKVRAVLRLTERNRQSVVVHSWQDFLGQVVVEAERVLRGRDAEVGRPPSTGDEPTQLLSGLKKKIISVNLRHANF